MILSLEMCVSYDFHWFDSTKNEDQIAVNCVIILTAVDNESYALFSNNSMQNGN